MAFRRFTKFRRRTGGFKRRTGLRTVTQNGAQRWERGEIGAINGLAVSDDDEIFTLTLSIAQIPGHLQPRADANQTRGAVALENIARSMEIGGISMDLGFRVPTFDAAADPNFGEAHGLFCMAGFVLYVDRLDGAGVPNALAPLWGKAGTPMVDPTTMNPDVTEYENNDFPQRILLRRSTHVDFCAASDTNGIFQFTRPVAPTHWHVNRRLRLRLPDDQGLFLAFWTRRASNWPAETTLNLNSYMAGSLYYRVRF